MSEKSSAIAAAEFGGRVLSGALGWVLVLLGSLGVVLTLLRIAGGTAPSSPVGSAVAFAVSVLVVAVGLYGNPRIRERIQSAL
ncbi:hypothetical protein ABSL23_13985 [Halobacterium sp. NMX12-1]|uniref:Uncharacterized protein n=1 Tax=Halobacterium sp. NMX12-1 TaxID=3166650 RepID=A0AAU8CCB5_9EURY